MKEIWSIVLGTSLAVLSGVLLFVIERVFTKFQNKKRERENFTLYLQDPS